MEEGSRGERCARWAVAGLWSILACVLLEVGTLFGAPVSSPLAPSDWRPARMLVFFALSLPLALWLRGRLWARRGPVPREGGAASGPAPGPMARPRPVGIHDLLRASPEYAFFAMSLCSGVLCAFLLPGYASSSWDGFTHFDVANAMSYVVDAEYTGADVIMATHNAHDWSQLIEGRRVFPTKRDAEARAAVHDFLADAERNADPLVCEGASVLGGGTWVAPAHVGNIPNAVGLWFGRLLHLGFDGRYIAGRVAGVLFYSLTMLAAMRRLRGGRLALGVFSLFPTLVILSASYTYDTWSVSLVAYAFAAFVGIYQKGHDNLSVREASSPLVPFVLGALVRAVYFPLLAPFLAVPSRRFSSRQASVRYRALVVLAAVAMLASFAVRFAVAPGGGDPQGSAGVSQGSQIGFILADPIRYAGVMLATTANVLSLDRLVAFEPLAFSAPYVTAPSSVQSTTINALLLGLALLVCVLDRTRCDLSLARPPVKALAALGLASGWMLAVTALYVSFTALGAPLAEGVQVRYLLALVPPAGMLLLDFGGVARRDLGARLRWLGPLAVLGSCGLLASALVVTFAFP